MSKSEQRIEALARAIEDTATAIAALSHHQAGASTPSKGVMEFKDAARAQLREKLREFVIPALTAIDGGKDRKGRIACPVCLLPVGSRCWANGCEQLNNCPNPKGVA